MNRAENKGELSKAFQIGIVCVFSYLASYYMRNLLGVVTPEMLATGRFTKEIVVTLSSVYFFMYAIGQLINGTVGDKVKARFMVLIGLTICGISSVIFAFTNRFALQILLFAIMGFALSMLRGPLVKTISENTIPRYARVCCVFFSFSSFAGPLVASLLAMIFDWQMTFVAAGISCVVVAICAYIVLTVLEKKKIIKSFAIAKKTEKMNIWAIFKIEYFVFYMFISGLIEISAASIGFWLPTYLTERMLFDENTANIIFSFITFARSFTPFLALVIFKYFKEDDIRMTKYSFFAATLFFIGVLFVSNRYINIFLFLLSLVSVSCASTLVWNVFIPKQAESGVVSTINGVLDFSGYAMSAAANMIFSFAADRIGWDGIIIMWIIMMASGAIASVIVKAKKPREKNNAEGNIE